MKRFVIFDLDGTLLNTIEDLAAAGNHALAQNGLPTHPVDSYKLFVGDGVYKLVERMTPATLRSDEALLVQLKAAFDTYYGAHGEDLTQPYDGIVPLLDALRERGVAAAVLTNKPHAFAQVLCPRYFGERLAFVIGQRDGKPTKPDAGLVAETLARAGMTAEESLYVGDTGVDMQTAGNGGVFALGALWGFRPREELVENGANALISHPSEILSWL